MIHFPYLPNSIFLWLTYSSCPPYGPYHGGRGYWTINYTCNKNFTSLFFIRWLKNFGIFIEFWLVGSKLLVPELFSKYFNQSSLILIYRRSNFVYHYYGVHFSLSSIVLSLKIPVFDNGFSMIVSKRNHLEIKNIKKGSCKSVIAFWEKGIFITLVHKVL